MYALCDLREGKLRSQYIEWHNALLNSTSAGPVIGPGGLHKLTALRHAGFETP
jgi:hypothetical protein